MSGDPDGRENIAEGQSHSDAHPKEGGPGDSSNEKVKGSDHSEDPRRGNFEKHHSTENIRSKEAGETTTSEASTEATTSTTSTQ